MRARDFHFTSETMKTNRFAAHRWGAELFTKRQLNIFEKLEYPKSEAALGDSHATFTLNLIPCRSPWWE